MYHSLQTLKSRLQKKRKNNEKMSVSLPLTFPVFAYLIETPSRVRFIIGFEDVKKNFAYSKEKFCKNVKEAEL